MRVFIQDTDIMRSKKLNRQILEYIFALVLPSLPLFLAIATDTVAARSMPMLFFFPAVALSAWVGGSKAGTLTSIVCGLLINYFFIPPYNAFTFTHPTSLLQTILFIAEGALISSFIHAGKRKDQLGDYKRREKEFKTKIVELESEVLIAQQNVRQRDEFLSIASHELKTPLTSMLLQTQTALHNIRNVSLEHFSIAHLLTMLESVENQTKRLSKMINDLLNVSILATGNIQIEKEEVDLGQVAKDVLSDFSNRLEKEGYKTIVTVDESVIGQWDKVRIEQAISNLLSNSIKYGQQKPIEIQVRKKEGWGQFIIKDEGIGITKEQQKRIFNLFERAVSPEQYKGLGVGLYITSQIVKAHEGSIRVQSNGRHGTTFIVSLPLKIPATIR